MARNFVILYCGREGSSAIMKAFVNRSDITIPVVEDFDRYQCPEVDENDVPIILRRTLATARFSTLVDRATDRLSDIALPDTPAVGFKWRIWGDPDGIAEVLLDHNVVIFELLRSDIVNLALSLYLTTYVLPLEQNNRFAQILRDPNPQFRIRRLEQSDQEEVISFIRSREFSVDPGRFIPIMEQYAASRLQIRRRYVDLFKAYQLEVCTLYYEEFLADAADFLGRVASVIGVTIASGQELFFPKVGRKDVRTQVINLAELESNRDVQRIKLSYYGGLIAKRGGSREIQTKGR
jgi:hypothetical protein